MNKLVIGLILAGTITFVLGVGFGNTGGTITGFVLFAIGVLIPRLMPRD